MPLNPRYNFLGIVFYRGDKSEIEGLYIEYPIAFAKTDDTNQFGVYAGASWLWMGSGGGGGAVDSVNGQTGVVVIDADDVSDAATVNKFATAAELSKLSGIEPGAQVNTVISVNGETGAVSLNQDDIGDGATYKQFSSAEKTKLSGIADGAEVNVNADWSAVAGDAQILNKPTLGDSSEKNVGTTAGTVAAGDDARFSDARTPVAHKSSHATGGGDALTPADIGAATAAQGALADSSIQPGNPALSDARVPLDHALSHVTGGDDEIPGPTGSSKGLAPALSGNASQYLGGDGEWHDLPSVKDVFLSNTDSAIGGYKSLVTTLPTGAEANSSAVITANGISIKKFALTAGSFDFVSGQVVHIHIHLAKTGGTKDAEAYCALYHRTSGGTETLIGSPSLSTGIISGVNTSYELTISIPDINFASSDQLVLEVLGNKIGGGTDPTVALYFEGTTNSRIEIGSNFAQQQATIVTMPKFVVGLKDGTSSFDGDVVLDGVNEYLGFATLSGTTYTLLRDVYASTFVVDNGITLVGAGNRIFCSTSFTNNGTVHNNGNNASGDTAGTAQGDALAAFGQGSAGGAGVASGAVGAVGQPGSDFATTNSGSGRSGWGGRGASAWVSVISQLGGTGKERIGSTGYRSYWNALEVIIGKHFNGNNPVRFFGGLGGGGGAKSATGTACLSGGGGSGAGCLLISAPTISNSGTITANGGNGADASGTGANAGGGGGGGGGIIWLIYDTLVNTGTIEAVGGIGGTSVAGGTTPVKAAAVAYTSNNQTTGTTRNLSIVANRPPSKNTLYLLAIHQSSGTLVDPTVTGYGLTWTKINSVDFGTIASPTRRLSLWYAYGTPQWIENDTSIWIRYPSSVTFNASLDEIHNATNTVVQSVTNRGNTVTALAGTLAALGSANNFCYGVYALAGGTARVAGASLTKISDVGSGNLIATEGGYNVTAINMTWTTGAHAGMIACEIQAIASMENGQPGHDGIIIHFKSA